MRRLLALCLLTACTAPPVQQPTYCDCVTIPTDEESIAMMGFTEAAILSQGMERLDNGDDLSWYQFDPAVATPEMIAASPGNTCGYFRQPVVSHRITDTYGDADMKEPGSKYLIVVCGPKVEAEGAT